MNRFRALALAAVCLFAIAGCAALFPQGDGVDLEAQLESMLLDEVDIANGVYVSKSVDGFSPVVSIRLYVDTDEVGEIAKAADVALETAWDLWPTHPSRINVGVVIGPKPADAGTSDVDSIDMTEAAKLIDIDPGNVNFDIRLGRSELIDRYGE